MTEKIKCDTPNNTLIAALEKVEGMGKVIVIWESPDGERMGSLDNDLTVADAIFLMKTYEYWIMSHMLKEE
jgi:hypothetical protein